MSSRSARCCMTLLLFAALPAPAGADDAAHDHHVGLFGGAATTTSGSPHPAIGAEYEYLLTRRWSVGAFTELVIADPGELVAGLPVVLHPVGGLRVLTAPIIAVPGAHAPHFGARAGLGYDFHAGMLTVSPVVNADWTGGPTVIVSGVACGIGL